MHENNAQLEELTEPSKLNHQNIGKEACTDGHFINIFSLSFLNLPQGELYTAVDVSTL